ncbi:MAG: hypothetical protein M1148_03355, partial [Candidatus Thermoplasmatota archaeon]|nr:hypothetical protein [Candidatus Thermoplasmatota archaeon]
GQVSHSPPQTVEYWGQVRYPEPPVHPESYSTGISVSPLHLAGMRLRREYQSGTSRTREESTLP